MSIAKTYDPKIAEDKWYKHWMEKGYFSSTPDEREPFTIMIYYLLYFGQKRKPVFLSEV